MILMCRCMRKEGENNIINFFPVSYCMINHIYYQSTNLHSVFMLIVRFSLLPSPVVSHFFFNFNFVQLSTVKYVLPKLQNNYTFLYY